MPVVYVALQCTCFCKQNRAFRVPITLGVEKRHHFKPQKLCSECVSRIYLAFIRTPCHSVPVLPYPRITMHNSCIEVSSADKSQPLHLLFIENGSHDESFNKQTKHCTYFHFPCCLCFGMDLSGLISWNEDVRRGEYWRGEGKYCSGRTWWELFGKK